MYIRGLMVQVHIKAIDAEHKIHISAYVPVKCLTPDWILHKNNPQNIFF